MTSIIIIALAIYAGYKTNQCHKQRDIIDAYEGSWNRIEDLSDHNKSGDVVIHVRPTEDRQTYNFPVMELDKVAPQVVPGVELPRHSEEKDEQEMAELINKRDKLNQEITALAQFMRITRS